MLEAIADDMGEPNPRAVAQDALDRCEYGVEIAPKVRERTDDPSAANASANDCIARRGKMNYPRQIDKQQPAYLLQHPYGVPCVVAYNADSVALWCDWTSR